VGLGEMASSPLLLLLLLRVCTCAVVRDLQVRLRCCAQWHVETRLSQSKSEVRIRIRRHSDLFTVR
jgi:hypothetical protein